MTKTWITADWHLGETRFAMMNRPFSDQQQMVDVLVENHNKLVHKDDKVYVLGDVCYQAHPEFLEQVNRFNGRKILVRGNHDRVFTDDQLKIYFDEIVADGKGIDLEILPVNVPIYLTHYPSTGSKGKFNLVGHVHNAWRVQLNMFNVGVDVNNYMPVDMDYIPFIHNIICDFYDEDVFAAYNPINSQYVDQRIRKSSYFSD